MSASASSSAGRLSTFAALGAVFGVAVLTFVIAWLAFPGQNHYGALLVIGALALVYAVLSYFVRAFAVDPTPLRAASWGFYGLGAAVLLLAITVDAPPGTGIIAQLVGVIVVLIVLFVGFAGAAWRGRATASDRSRADRQAAWRQQPVASAFSYSTANPPAVGPPPVAAAPPPPPGGHA
ncbi:MAG TPA: hypothetical protein VGU43_03255 [Thermoplasmata archaeon]|nr:hypothetical protein [Thermoplasmata archaeon]